MSYDPKPRSFGTAMRSDAWHKRQRGFAEARAKELRPFIEFYHAHPIATAMNLRDWKETHPDFPCNSLSNLKGKLTILRRKGLV